MNSSKFIPTHLTALVLALFATGAFAQAFIELPDGRREPVDRILATPDGTLTIFRPGQTQSVQIPREAYVRAIGVRPPEIDQANQLISQGETEQAIQLLNTVFNRSMFQTWDVVAGITLANLRIEGDRPTEARRIVDVINQRYGERTLEIFPQLEQVQWRTRIATGQLDGLEEELTTIIRDGSERDRVGMALMTRGDIKRRRAELRPAILDYLRAVYFYRNNETIHAEALYRAGSAFAELGDTANARKFHNELRERHPNSEPAARVSAN